MKNVTLTQKLSGQSHKLIVDGEIWEDTWGYKGLHTERMIAGIRETSLSKIAKLTVRQLLSHFERVTLDLPNNEASPYGLHGWEFNEIVVRMDRVDDRGHAPLRCEVYFEFENWSNTYTIVDLAQTIQVVLAEHPELPLKYWTPYDSIAEGFGVEGAADLDDTIEHVLLLEKDLLDLSKLIEAHIEEQERRRLFKYIGEAPPPRKVTVLFSFPAPVKNACEQYLLYFGQFLSDLGVEAETQLSETAARVLFSVTPKDAMQALTQIRDALETYLRLPYLPEFQRTAGQFHDPSVAQLQANVLHFQSQVVLAKSMLQAMDATIRAKDTEIGLLRGMIDLRGYVAMPKKSHEESDSEPLIGDVVRVKKYTLKFLELDFPAILRKLKRRVSGT